MRSLRETALFYMLHSELFAEALNEEVRMADIRLHEDADFRAIMQDYWFRESIVKIRGEADVLAVTIRGHITYEDIYNLVVKEYSENPLINKNRVMGQIAISLMNKYPNRI